MGTSDASEGLVGGSAICCWVRGRSKVQQASKSVFKGWQPELRRENQFIGSLADTI